jgi:hypothetical protein
MMVRDNGLGLFLSQGQRRIMIALVQSCVDDSGKCKKVVLKCGNVGCQCLIDGQDFSGITQ